MKRPVAQIREVRRLAAAIGMSQGELLQLAREASHDGSLASVDLMTFGVDALQSDLIVMYYEAQEKPKTFAAA